MYKPYVFIDVDTGTASGLDAVVTESVYQISLLRSAVVQPSIGDVVQAQGC